MVKDLDTNSIQESIVKAVEKVSDSLVLINSLRVERRFPAGYVPLEGQGSGFIIDSSGMIATNNHVVDGVQKVTVTLKDGSTYSGDVVGTDSETDIAIVKINACGLKAAELGNSEELKVGQFVLAVGNALGLPGGPTVSFGVLSAVGRPLPGADFVFEGLLQTDAAVNPGNSGGPLSDIEGRVIGMNTAMVPFAQGVGFAIPINTVKSVASELITHGKVTRRWIGVSGVEVNSSIARRYSLIVEHGFLVVEVVRGSPAHVAGLRPGDVVVRVNEREVTKTRDMLLAISEAGDGFARITVARNDRFLTISVRPLEREESMKIE
jgi:S1-C subfamily serine protease